MPLPKSLSKHGTFIYGIPQTIQEHGGAAQAAQAVAACGMQHVWVRIHGRNTIDDSQAMKDFIKACKDAGIGVAGWGWCQGEKPKAEAEMAKKALTKLGLTDYVADIEQGVSNAQWTQQEVELFFSVLRSNANGPTTVGLSSHGFIDYHEPELLKPALPYVDVMCPQTYWFRYPTKKLLKAVGESETEFPLDDPASYLKLCVKRWKKHYGKPVVATGQAYVSSDESTSFTQKIADEKVESFLATFDAWKTLAGLNWWYFTSTSDGSMSQRMYSAIRAAKLNSKPFTA